MSAQTRTQGGAPQAHGHGHGGHNHRSHNNNNNNNNNSNSNGNGQSSGHNQTNGSGSTTSSAANPVLQQQQTLLSQMARQSLGLAIKVTMNTPPRSSKADVDPVARVFEGRLFAFDVFSGLLVVQSAAGSVPEKPVKEEIQPATKVPKDDSKAKSISEKTPVEQAKTSWASAVSKSTSAPVTAAATSGDAAKTTKVEYEKEIPKLEASQQSFTNNVGLVDFSILKVSQIASVERLPLERAKIHPALVNPHPIHTEKLAAREQQGVKLAKEALRRMGDNVTADAQRIFDELYKTQPGLKWDGKSIVILGEVKVLPDNGYTVDDVKFIGKDPESSASKLLVDRTKKILQATRTKLNL